MGKTDYFRYPIFLEVEHGLKLAGELREALASNQLTLDYQPQVGGDAQVFGLEALDGWSHPDRGMVGPNEFIPIAEEIGLIYENEYAEN